MRNCGMHRRSFMKGILCNGFSSDSRPVPTASARKPSGRAALSHSSNCRLEKILHPNLYSLASGQESRYNGIRSK